MDNQYCREAASCCSPDVLDIRWHTRNREPATNGGRANVKKAKAVDWNEPTSMGEWGRKTPSAIINTPSNNSTRPPNASIPQTLATMADPTKIRAAMLMMIARTAGGRKWAKTKNVQKRALRPRYGQNSGGPTHKLHRLRIRRASIRHDVIPTFLPVKKSQS